MPYLADVSKPDAVAAMVEAAVNEFGGVDIAVNNAGLRRQTPFLQMNLEEWHEILSVALDGAFILAKAHDDPAVAADCIAHLRRYIETQLPTSQTTDEGTTSHANAT